MLDFRHKKRPQLRSIYILLVPKAGLEPAHLSMVDFESTAPPNSLSFIDSLEFTYG